ncbi:FecR family protein [Joostella atrarenae]|uniref:FecR family protein n=1 Tax=Joostella atrarenae TaxID=679257 RepID=A0ABS9J2Y4_9FLAO|nr:FecR family protein [Joostella atrarenae]MCF8714797.1 FecR family protein [Joostella atrarenae]
MKKDTFSLLIEKYSRGECSTTEKKQIELFFRRMQNRNIDIESNEKILSSKIYSKIKNAISVKKRKDNYKGKKHTFLKIAASLFIIVSCGLLYNKVNNPEKLIVNTALGERKEINLPDGSIVTLNAGSSITYPSEFNDGIRIVSLKGEGFFDVFHNKEKPFEVHTKHLITKVLGTSFNINAYEEQKTTKISVTSGKVKVYNNKKINEHLIKNEQITYNYLDQTVIKGKEVSVNDIAWKDNIMLINDLSLEATTKVIEKWFDIKVKIDDDTLISKKITGKFNNPSLEEVLESLQFLAKIDYRFITEKQIEIKKEMEK